VRWRPIGTGDKPLVDGLVDLRLPAIRIPLTSPSIEAQYCREVADALVDQ